jgi:hypothetical protein
MTNDQMMLLISAAGLIARFRIVWTVTNLQQDAAVTGAATLTYAISGAETRQESTRSTCRRVEQRLALFRLLREGQN